MTFDLFLRIDQNRGALKHKDVLSMSNCAKRTVLKEVKNLEFNVKFKEGEPRNKGRITPAITQ